MDSSGSGYSEELSVSELDKPIQLVVRRKPRTTAFFRAVPYTAYQPTEAQIKARLAFAEAARRARGIRYAGTGARLPTAAEIVRREMKGRVFSERVRMPKWLEILSRVYPEIREAYTVARRKVEALQHL